MNKRENIFKVIADEIGVSFDEVFRIKKYPYDFILTKIGLRQYDENIKMWVWWSIEILLDNIDSVVKIPFKPKYCQKYWYVNTNGFICSDIFHEDCYIHYSRYALSNTFRTKEEAEQHKKEYMKRMSDIYNGKLAVKFEEIM